MPGCPSFLVCLSGVAAGVSVSLATDLFLNLLGTVARAGVPMAISPFF